MVGHLAYLGLGISPIGGALASIPFGIFQMKYPAWFVIASTPPLAYVQVLAVDMLWDTLSRWSVVKRALEQKRSPRVERLLQSGGSFWATLLVTPVAGPWVVMAFMRYAQVPQRRVALPMLLSLLGVAVVLVSLCRFVPGWFSQP